ncbi:lysylphosphatidylglycerol synthase transmembrane domain-containing protein [Brevibacterium pigmentatum]|uniref:lysylphosphatidylglycerol synthase transmembrane domain-containing protein n=1 Tax=Brevibacterium pigmentatum TaxID=1496080 RepID=UPI00141D8FBC|nr:lysylphosphatidylglycerol synthase transmembrane domain-containing protein [Brevibacterium pigmentatum]
MTWAKRALMLAITVALLALTVRVVGAQALVDGWQVLNVWTVLTALACGFIMTGAQALRWTLLLAHRGTAITWSRALADCYSSSLLNMVLPGGLGGDAARVAVYRHTGPKKWLSPLAAVGAERLSTTTLLFATAALCLIDVSGRLALIAAAVSVATLVISVWGMRGMDWQRTFSIWASSALGMAALFVLFLIAMAALGGPVVPVLAVVGLAAMSIPIGVGGWGVREISVSLIAAGISVSMDTAVTASTGYGLLAVISTLPGIVTVWAAGTRRKQVPARSDSAANEQPQPD